MTRELTVGVTGASGAPVAVSFLQALLRQREISRLHLILSEQAHPVLAQELGGSLKAGAADLVAAHLNGDPRVTAWRNDQLGAAIASGSHAGGGMVIVPCSVNTLSAVACGRSDRLITRVADVTLKERRPLLLAVRESPLSAAHLENMLRVTRNGAVVMPICPAFYLKPDSIQELIDNFVLRILDHLGLAADRGRRWGTGPRRQ
ncbi:MAG: UbiX family flavin prenyltransferase [Acidobacteriota bacterium]